MCHKLYKLRIAPCCALPQSYKYSHSRAAYASLRAHTCCLRNRIRSLTRASRATSPSAFSKSLYSKLYRLPCHFAASQFPRYGTHAILYHKPCRFRFIFFARCSARRNRCSLATIYDKDFTVLLLFANRLQQTGIKKTTLDMKYLLNYNQELL